MKTNILNNVKNIEKLLKIIDLNQKGINYVVNKSASAIDLGLSKSEFFQIMTKKLGKFMETLAFFPKADKMRKR